MKNRGQIRDELCSTHRISEKQKIMYLMRIFRKETVMEMSNEAVI